MTYTSLIAVITAAALATQANALPTEEFVPYPEAGGVRLGTGWDSFGGAKTTASCVVAAEFADTGQRRLVNYKEVSDTSSLMNALSLSAKAKAKSLFGGSASASSSFSRTVKVDTANLNIGVDVKIIQGARYLAPPRLGRALEKSFAAVPDSSAMGAVLVAADAGDRIRLTPRAERLYRSNRPRFRAECGDSFVSSIRAGGGLQGVYAFQTKTVAEKRDLSAKIKAGFGPFSGQASMRQLIERMDKESRLAINYFQLGGSGLPIATSEPAFRNLVETIGSVTSDSNAAPFEIGITPYSQLSGVTSGDELGAMDALANQYYRLFSLRREIDEMLTGSDYFFDRRVTRTGLGKIQDRIASDMDAIRAAISACTQSQTPCAFPAGVAKTDYGYRAELPVRANEVADRNQLMALKKELEAKRTELGRTPEFRRIRVGRARLTIPNPAYPPLKQAAASLEGRVSALEASADSTRERFDTWIDLPNRVRCQEEEHDVCISNAEADQILTRMLEA